MFLRFTNFYYQFIQRFSWIAALLTSMLKTSKSIESAKQLKKDIVGITVNTSARRDRSKFDRSEIDDNEVGGSKVDNEVGKKCQKMSKYKNLFKFKKLSKSKKTLGSDFLILKAKLGLIKLRQAFFRALIFYHFDPEHHIHIEMDVSGYTNERIFSQLISESR